MFKRVFNHAKALGLNDLLKSGYHQSTVGRLIKNCPVCHGQIQKCQPLECYRTWQVYGESPIIDLHNPYRKGRLLFEKQAFYWQVIPSAINHNQFYRWDYGGFILKKGIEPPPKINK